jgi:CheY-like chemotaxis protein
LPEAWINRDLSDLLRVEKQMSDDQDLAPYALIADDDAFIRMDAADILEAAGFLVHEASNVAEAIELLEHHAKSVQLLFTDVHMPPGELTGFDLARQCAERWPDIGILIASGAAKPAVGDIPDGAIFINKPFSADVVHDRLQELLPDGKKPLPLKRKAT